MQKEAYFCGKRAIVVMPDTGWRELVEVGWNRLSEPDEIFEKYQEIVDERLSYIPNIYGQGESSKEIVRILSLHFGG